jgi:hypothetical protein
VFDEVAARLPAKKRKARTQTQPYKEAVRATHLIANELADISDEEEFDDMLQFVLMQWHNVRQRKLEPADNVRLGPRVSPPADIADAIADAEMGEVEEKGDNDDDAMEPMQPSEPVELSQPHSLWGEEVGVVAHVDPTSVKFKPLVAPSQDAPEQVNNRSVLFVDNTLNVKIEGSAKAASESSESEPDSDGGETKCGCGSGVKSQDQD